MADYPHRLSSWAMNIAPSPTLAVDAKAKALKAAGHDVCSFGAGEPDFDTPDFIKEACMQALRDGETKYGPASGLLRLREEVAKKYARDNAMPGLKPSQVVISPGGKYSCMLAVMAVVSPGDEVIIPAPYWVSYPEMVKLAGGKPVVVFAGKEQGFKMAPEQLREAITDKTRLLIMNSPSNPTGAVYSREEMESIIAICLERGIYVMADEIYEYLLYDDRTHWSPASWNEEASRLVITVGGFSKTFSMTGWRLGTLVAAEPVATCCADIQSQTTSGPTTFAQYGALASLLQPEAAQAAIASMLEAFDRRRIFLYDGLNAIEGLDCPRAQGAFYLFPDIASCGMKANDFASRLLDEQKVAVVPGEGFGAPDYIRLSYATSDAVIEEGLNRLQEFCQSLRG